MPLYEYHCKPCNRVTPKFRSIPQRHDPVTCNWCNGEAGLIISRSSVPPDGVYSYAPNVGDPNVFERRWENLKKNKRLSDGNE